MTLNQLARIGQEMLELSLSKSKSKQLRAQELAALIEKKLPFAKWQTAIECEGCFRKDRRLYACGVWHQKLVPLCSHRCVDYWRRDHDGEVFLIGRAWEQMPRKQAA